MRAPACRLLGIPFKLTSHLVLIAVGTLQHYNRCDGWNFNSCSCACESQTPIREMFLETFRQQPLSRSASRRQTVGNIMQSSSSSREKTIGGKIGVCVVGVQSPGLKIWGGCPCPPRNGGESRRKAQKGLSGPFGSVTLTHSHLPYRAASSTYSNTFIHNAGGTTKTFA